MHDGRKLGAIDSIGRKLPLEHRVRGKKGCYETTRSEFGVKARCMAGRIGKENAGAELSQYRQSHMGLEIRSHLHLIVIVKQFNRSGFKCFQPSSARKRCIGTAKETKIVHSNKTMHVNGKSRQVGGAESAFAASFTTYNHRRPATFGQH